MRPPGTFASELARLRKSVGASYSELDRKLGTCNYIARVESGSLPVPGRARASLIGSILRELGADTDGASMWALAAPERDPEVTEFFEARIRKFGDPIVLAVLEEENRRLRATIETIRRTLEDT